jgi:hypothetical protein
MSGLSDSHKAARLGKLGASQVHEALARTKTGWGASRENILGELALERITGEFTERYTSPAMQYGNDMQARAEAAYTFRTDRDIIKVEWMDHPYIKGAGCSPDGLVGDVGLVEIKCPNPATHWDTLMGSAIKGSYMTQMQWQMACTGRAWCDFVSFDIRFPEESRIKIIRVQRDQTRIAELETQVPQFLVELEAKLDDYRKLYPTPDQVTVELDINSSAAIPLRLLG